MSGIIEILHGLISVLQPPVSLKTAAEASAYFRRHMPLIIGTNVVGAIRVYVNEHVALNAVTISFISRQRKVS